MAREVDLRGMFGLFMVQNEMKQGGVLAPILFNLFYAGVIMEMMSVGPPGGSLWYCMDGSVFNL